MSFRDMVQANNKTVFANTDEFADEHVVKYDGETFHKVHCVISQLKEKDRAQASKDHAQGIYYVTAVCHFPIEDLEYVVPEKGCRIDISDETGFMKRYYVAQSGCDMGMVRLELEAYDE